MAKTSCLQRFGVEYQFSFIAVAILCKYCCCDIVFQPSFVITSAPRVSAFLIGNTSDISLSLTSLSPSNATGRLPPPSCVATRTQWVLSKETIGIGTSRVQLELNRSLVLCGNESECCPQPLCVLETLRVTACRGVTPQASLLIQAEVYAQALPSGPVSDNMTVIPNQVFQPLGSCPCDLSRGVCDIRCCCDGDCSPELLWLFEGRCLPGLFGGGMAPAPDYQCSEQAAQNAPDWFPFLCVTSPPKNSPFLGLFYHGKTITPKSSPSFQSAELAAPVPPSTYRQGDPIFTTADKYFTIPQSSMLGQCVDNAPVAFLENMQTECVSRLLACPADPVDLVEDVTDGLGGVVTVSVVDEVANDTRLFVSSSPREVTTFTAPSAGTETQRRQCVDVTLALRYTLYWMGSGLTNITLTRTLGTVTLGPDVFLTTRFSAVFVNGNTTSQSNSGNTGYLLGKPVIGGSVDLETGTIKRASINLWQPVGDGLCPSAGLTPVLFGHNSSSGCVLPVTLDNFTQCGQLRETVRSLLMKLVTATLIGQTGNPDLATLTDWVNISRRAVNSSTSVDGLAGACPGVPAHLHLHVHTVMLGTVGGLPRRQILSVRLSHRVATWRVECAGGGANPCLDPSGSQFFPLTSSVTFTERPVYAPPVKSRFQVNFTEYDCDRNDVCWPELAFPLTRRYKGEPYSQALAKGLILVVFFIAASVLGSPWRQIRQAWSSYQG